MTTIAFITTCKGRLHHLKQTLPRFVSAAPDEIVVVDYGCPDGSGEWVEGNFSGVSVVRVTDDPLFCLSRARNKGAAIARSEWLCFIDADILIDPEWVAWMRESLENGGFYRAELVAGERDRNAWGTCICPRSAFDAVGGYDEVIRGWGVEDDDFYLRLKRLGLVEREFPARFAAGIPHGDEERTAFHENKNRFAQRDINRCYVEIKQFLGECRGEVGTELLSQLFEALSHEVPVQRGDGSKPWRARISLKTQHGIKEFEMGWRRRYWLFGPRDFFLEIK